MIRLLAFLGTGSILTAAPTALDRYVAQPDPAYRFQLERTVKLRSATAFQLDMTSQRFLTTKEVDRPEWRHWVTIIKPDRVKHTAGLLFIGGGNNGDGPPRPREEMVRIAVATQSVVADIRMVPNQPLRFIGERKARREDEIIAYTWDQFLRTGDEKWPLRLPMTKAAVRALDTVTTFMKSGPGGGLKVDRFVVTGGSKRGWTTWSTAVVDRRVVAIIPLVIDMLNIRPSFNHHHAAYGHYAEAVHDYVDMGILKRMDTPRAEQLRRIEDPYEYRDRLTLPKFLINSAADQFFLPDSWQFYWDGLKGPKHLRYVPNTGHSLRDSDAVDSLAAFYHAILNRVPLPRYEWKVEKTGALIVRVKDQPREIRLWRATNPKARDFRIDKLGPRWTSTMLKPRADGAYHAPAATPPKGWTASLIELTFPGPLRPFKFTTGVVVTPKKLPFSK